MFLELRECALSEKESGAGKYRRLCRRKSPPHGGSDPGAVFAGRQEKDDNLRLVLAVGELLEDNGVEVAYTRTEDVYDTPLQKAQIANEEGGDFFLSIHRNSSQEPDQYSGVETLVFDLSPDKVALAEAINAELEEVGFANLGVKERTDLIVLKRTQMPAVLAEIGFLNTEADNLLFDEQFPAIAEAIAGGILSVLEQMGLLERNGIGENVPEPSDSTQKILYRVQVGAFRNRANAEDLLYRLQRQNYPAFLLYADGLYKVQAGAFAQLDNAIRMEEALRRAGYSTFITVQ